MATFRACKLTFNGKHYRINAQRVVAEVLSTDAVLNDPSYVNIRFCDSVESDAVLAEVTRLRHNKARRSKDQAMRDLGLVRVRGALGGVYWE